MTAELIFGNVMLLGLICTITTVIAVYLLYTMGRSRGRLKKEIKEVKKRKNELESELAELEIKYAGEVKNYEEKWKQQKNSIVKEDSKSGGQ